MLEIVCQVGVFLHRLGRRWRLNLNQRHHRSVNAELDLELSGYVGAFHPLPVDEQAVGAALVADPPLPVLEGHRRVDTAHVVVFDADFAIIAPADAKGAGEFQLPWRVSGDDANGRVGQDTRIQKTRKWARRRVKSKGGYNLSCMANVTVVTGAGLILLGLAGYLGTASHSPTALIPAGFGIVLAILGWLARDAERRKLVMHIAVVVGLLGFLGSLPGLIKVFRLLGGATLERPTAAIAQAVMCLITGIFVALCVKSFIDARRSGAI